MKEQIQFTRRNVIGTILAGTAGLAAAGAMQGCKSAPPKTGARAMGKHLANPRIRGPFPILSTPYLENGKVDFDVLAKEARFVNWCESPGMIWPQSGDSCDLLTMDEKKEGMEVLAKTMKGRKTSLCLGVQGNDTAEMLEYARHAEKLAEKYGSVTALISRPPDSGKNQDDLKKYWEALAEVAKRPVIIQTSGGTKYRGPAPSVDLMIGLAKRHDTFGYIKEEAGNVTQRMKREVAAKPPIKCVFCAWGGPAWLYQSTLGIEGLITERCAYADLLNNIWQAMDEGDHVKAAVIFSRLLLMFNISTACPGTGLRQAHLYSFQVRGVFKNRLSREYGPKNSIPNKPNLQEYKMNQEQMDEVEARIEALKPYIKAVRFEDTDA